MESWCFDSSVESYVSNETVTPRNALLAGCDIKAPYTCHESSNTAVADNTPPGHTTDEDIAVLLAKQYNAFWRDDESTCSKRADSNYSRESSLFDLKVGGEVATVMCSTTSESSMQAKRARGVSSLSSHDHQAVYYCQVFGCNKDLSSSKDYHKRHRVCDVHSKTATVIVSGIEQRFCQQCSRFHLLAEFDEGKRSCRKRLAEHNERRRKPQLGFGRNRSGRSLHSYSGCISSKFQGTTLAATSFICQDILDPNHREKYATNIWNKDIKTEHGPNAYGQLGQKTILPPYPFGKESTSVLDNGVYIENMNQYPHETVPRSLFHTNSLGSEEFGCALSLLSSQSQNSHSYSASVIQSSCPHFGMTQVYYDSQGLTAKNYPNTLPMLDDGDVDFANGTLHGLSCEEGTTIDLLQLSSQIQHVENQRQTGPVK